MSSIIHQARGLRRIRDRGERDALGSQTLIGRRVHQTRARTLALTSGKGGVGKTQLAANLAVALAQRGQRVVLFDADLGLASLDLALGLRPVLDLRAVLRGERDVFDVIVEGPQGVSLLPACPGRYEMANLGPRERQLLVDAIQRVAEAYDVMIIDTGAGIGSNAIEFAALADEIAVVVTADPASLRDAYAVIKVLHRRAGVQQVQLIGNQVQSDVEGVEIHERLSGIVDRFLQLNLTYLGCVPRDETVRSAAVSGAPYMIESPNSLAAQATYRVMHRLYPELVWSELC